MTDTEVAEADDAKEDIETPEAEDNAPDIEAKATRLGWRPKDEFKGDPDKWVDADEFVRRGEEDPALLRANYKKVEDALERANANIARLDRTNQKLIKHLSTTEQRAYDKARKDIEAKLDQAAEAGDVEGVRAAAREISDLTKEAVDPSKDLNAPDEPPELTAWKEENEWFEKDAAMRGAVIAIADELAADGITDLKRQIREIDKRIRVEFPHKFENPARKAAATVEAANNGARRKTGKTYADLPADAKAMCDDFCKNIKGFTREQFVRDYQW